MAQRPIYNEDQKMAFINDEMLSDNTRKRAISIFTACAPYEKQFGADMSTMPDDKLIPMLEQVSGLRMKSKYTKISVIRSYMHWCVEHGILGARELGNYTYDQDTTKTRDFLVRNPEHLQQCMNLVFDKESEETQDNVYRCFLWLAYGGMSEAAAYATECDDVSFEYMEVTREDEVAIIYRQGLAAVRNCAKLTEFRYYNPTYIKAGVIRRNRVQSKRLLRGIREDQTLENFRSQLSRKLKKKRDSGVRIDELTYKRVWLSGVFYRTYEAEQAGIKPNFLFIAREIPGKPVSQNDANTFKADYLRWKAAITNT